MICDDLSCLRERAEMRRRQREYLASRVRLLAADGLTQREVCERLGRGLSWVSEQWPRGKG